MKIDKSHDTPDFKRYRHLMGEQMRLSCKRNAYASGAGCAERIRSPDLFGVALDKKIHAIEIELTYLRDKYAGDARFK